jgi:hypothetical protein
MKTVYPELPLYLDAIHERIQELPRATPLQKCYREDLDIFAKTVPETVPETSDFFPLRMVIRLIMLW